MGQLEKDFSSEMKSVMYYQRKADIEGSSFKKMIHIKEKEEEKLYENLRFNNEALKNQYDKERSI